MSKINGEIQNLREDARFQEYAARYGIYAAARLAEKIYLESNRPPRESLRELTVRDIPRTYILPAYVIGSGIGMHQLKEVEGIFFVSEWGEGNKNTLDVKFFSRDRILSIK